MLDKKYAREILADSKTEGGRKTIFYSEFFSISRIHFISEVFATIQFLSVVPCLSSLKNIDTWDTLIPSVFALPEQLPENEQFFEPAEASRNGD